MAIIADRITRPAASAASDVTGRTPGEIFILTCKILCSCVILHFHCKLDIECLILIKYTFSLPKPDDSLCQSTFSLNSPRKEQGGGAQHHVQCQPRVIITLRGDCYRCGNLFCGADAKQTVADTNSFFALCTCAVTFTRHPEGFEVRFLKHTVGVDRTLNCELLFNLPIN